MSNIPAVAAGASKPRLDLCALAAAPSSGTPSLKTKVASAVHSAWEFVVDRPYHLVQPSWVFCGGAALQMTATMPDINPENPAAIAALATGILAAKSLMTDPRPPHQHAQRPAPGCPDP